MRTFTPELTEDVLNRLRAFAAQFDGDFPRKDQARWTEAFLLSRLHDGDRKSVEPSIGRITLPPQCQTKDPIQGVQHWLRAYPKTPAARNAMIPQTKCNIAV